MGAFLTGLWGKLAAAAAIAGAVLLAVLKIRQGGRDAERAAAAARATDMRRKGDEVENRVDAAGGVELDRLRDKWTRPE